jgi:hypothetical protein
MTPLAKRLTNVVEKCLFPVWAFVKSDTVFKYHLIVDNAFFLEIDNTNRDAIRYCLVVLGAALIGKLCPQQSATGVVSDDTTCRTQLLQTTKEEMVMAVMDQDQQAKAFTRNQLESNEQGNRRQEIYSTY